MISSGQVTVGTAVAVQIDGSSVNPTYLTVHNNDNTKVMYLGGSDVSTTNGLALLKEETVQLRLNPGEALYAISSSGDHVISWLRQTV
jgi:archaellum component FlaG (FlaF/FlaG flagellin family)